MPGWKQAALIAASISCALGGCHFDVHGLDLPSISAIDLGGMGGDLPPGDLPPGAFAPSNISPTHVQDGAASLVGPKDIDTEKLLIDGQPPAPGVIFTPELTHDGWAVLSVHDFTIDSDLTVHGRRGLIVVAVGNARISALIHAEANLRTPGPGGQFIGPGHGGDGKSNGPSDSGGGGGGHGAVGAGGGPSDAATDGEGGVGGATYGDPLGPGSGGGSGAGINSMVAMPCPAGGGFSLGGAGGGVFQLSVKGTLDLVAGGGINAGGGGGRGGCQESASAGGGGGSAGTIWLEAPMMRILGKLAANGGGGGSGGRNGFLTADDGKDGANGALSVAVAAGGASRGSDSGAGGAGGAKGTDATPGSQDLNGGGGGGAIGRIRLRTSMVAPVTDPSTVISPAPDLTVDF